MKPSTTTPPSVIQTQRGTLPPPSSRKLRLRLCEPGEAAAASCSAVQPGTTRWLGGCSGIGCAEMDAACPRFTRYIGKPTNQGSSDPTSHFQGRSAKELSLQSRDRASKPTHTLVTRTMRKTAAATPVLSATTVGSISKA